MGRKGVSKRKTSKSKSNEGGNGAAPSIARVSEAPVAKSIGKGEALSVSKGGKKK